MKPTLFFTKKATKHFMLFAATLVTICCYAEEKQPRKPNVIVILADDLGKYDTDLYTGSCVSTPHINSMAKNGVKFEEAYATAAICSPSRAALLTGKYQQRFGYEFQPHKIYPRNFVIRTVYGKLLGKEFFSINRTSQIPTKKEVKNEGLPQNEYTIAEHFKSNGYSTAIMGKWHLGYNAPNLPEYAGFDEHYGFYEAFSLYADTKDTSVIEARQNDFLDKHIWKNGRKDASLIRHNGTVVDEKGYITFTIAEHTNRFIEENKNQPFFAYVPFSAPHTPFQAPKKYYDKFCHEQDHTKRVYYAMIAAMDDAIGSILQKLKDLNLEEETIIVFASDNGGATYTNATDNGSLKGGKFMLFEGGVSIPMTIQWKNHIAPKNSFQYPVNLCDVFPTVAAAAGIPVNEDAIDGVNLLPYLDGKITTAPHESIFWKNGYNRAIRKGDWKLVVDDKNQILHLYNILEDKFETADAKDIFKEKLEELLSDLNRWSNELPQPSWPHVLDYKIKIDGKEYEFAI